MDFTSSPALEHCHYFFVPYHGLNELFLDPFPIWRSPAYFVVLFTCNNLVEVALPDPKTDLQCQKKGSPSSYPSSCSCSSRSLSAAQLLQSRSPLLFTIASRITSSPPLPKIKNSIPQNQQLPVVSITPQSGQPGGVPSGSGRISIGDPGWIHAQGRGQQTNSCL